MERDIGRKLEWAAVNHYNTAHPHAHVVVRGVDREGRQVRFDRSYISNGMRWRAEEIATQELGPRPEFEIRRAYAREVTQERFTSLDRELERRAKDGHVNVSSAHSRGRIDEAMLLGRLAQLQKMGLAVRASPVEWQLTAGWQDTLRALGTRGDILKQMHAAIRGDPGRWHAVGPGQPLPDGYGGIEEQLLVGRVAAKGLADELKGTFYAVLETPTGTAYHVAIGPKTVESIGTGDLVTFESKPARAVGPVDLHIAEVALRQAGVYAIDPAVPLTGERAPAARRLRELARLRLVTAHAAGHWSVPADLIEQLEEHHKTEPARHRLFVHKQPLPLETQVTYRGRVWLDRVDPETLALHGLGAQVAHALEKRRQVLRELDKAGSRDSSNSNASAWPSNSRSALAKPASASSQTGSADAPRNSSRPGARRTQSSRTARASSWSARRRLDDGIARLSPSPETQRAVPFFERRPTEGSSSTPPMVAGGVQRERLLLGR